MDLRIDRLEAFDLPVLNAPRLRELARRFLDTNLPIPLTLEDNQVRGDGFSGGLNRRSYSRIRSPPPCPSEKYQR